MEECKKIIENMLSKAKSPTTTPLGLDIYYMNFIVSLAKIPGGLFAAVFLKLFPNRPIFLGSAILVILAHFTTGLANMGTLPPEFALVAVAAIQFASTAGYVSVAGLLLGVLLPSSSRSTFTGIIATIEGLSALSQSIIRPYIVDAIGQSGLFFVFGGLVTICLVYMFFMMPETKGVPLEKIEYIFLCPRHEGCTIRRDPNALITDMVNKVKSIARFCEKATVREPKIIQPLQAHDKASLK